MNRLLVAVFVAAVALYLPTVQYGFVQDDRAIIASNPAAHSVGAALRAFDDPYWPPQSGAGLYRPLTILTFAVDWSLSGGRAGWLHLMSAFWHGIVTVLLVLVLTRWLPPLAAAAAGLIFAWHPVHVEAVAGLVGRAELLVAAGVLGSVLAARRGWWGTAVLCAGLAMLSKEHGVTAGVVILLDRWLQGTEARRYPIALWVGLTAVTSGFIAVWFAVGGAGGGDAAAVFYGRTLVSRLAVAFPAILHAAVLLFWPASLSTDYNPQVLPVRDGFSMAALLGMLVAAGSIAMVGWCKRRAPAVSFAAGVAVLSYLPTANVLFASGVVLAERNLYLAAALPAALLGTAVSWSIQPRTTHDARRTTTVISGIAAVILLLLGWRSLDRLPVWRDNRTQLLTLLTDHPESYRAHGSAAAVLAGTGDTAGARREYHIADSLFPRDPYLTSARAMFLLGIHDTAEAVGLISRAEASSSGDRAVLRARFLLALERGDRVGARALADSAQRRFQGDSAWYLKYGY